MRWVAALAFVAVACGSGQPSNDEVARLSGIVTNIDIPNQTISLSEHRGETPSTEVIRYNSLTIVDRLRDSAHVEDLEFGDDVIVYGRRDKTTGDVTAERIVLITPASGKK